MKWSNSGNTGESSLEQVFLEANSQSIYERQHEPMCKEWNKSGYFWSCLLFKTSPLDGISHKVNLNSLIYWKYKRKEWNCWFLLDEALSWYKVIIEVT